MKRFKTLFLTALCFCAFINKANAQTWDISATAADHVTATLSGGTLTICGTGAMQNFTSGGTPWYSALSGITSLVIEYGVANIGDAAFGDCYNIAGNVTFPNSVTSIGVSSFWGCSHITSLTIPASVSSISSSAFRYYNGSSITCLNSNPNNITLGGGVFYGADVTTCVLYVPAGSETDYGNAPQWSDFNIIEAIIPPVVTTLPATDITQNTATLNVYLTIGTEPLMSQGWYYKKSNEATYTKATDGNLTGLTPNTDYDFFAYASTDAYPLVSGDTLHFTTLNTDGVDVIEQSNLQLYLNPTNYELTITTWKAEGNYGLGIENYSIVNMTGQALMQGKLQGETTTINVSALPSGVYFIKVGAMAGKFVKN